jgi:tRNA-specific 2-thiouridylase
MTSQATVSVVGDEVTADLHTAQTGVAAGQALVLYDDDVVLGSATITATERAASQPA